MNKFFIHGFSAGVSCITAANAVQSGDSVLLGLALAIAASSCGLAVYEWRKMVRA